MQDSDGRVPMTEAIMQWRIQAVIGILNSGSEQRENKQNRLSAKLAMGCMDSTG